MRVDGGWRGVSPDLPGWAATADNLNHVVDLAAQELRRIDSEEFDLRVVHVPSHR
jgi:hypothetical protein